MNVLHLLTWALLNSIWQSAVLALLVFASLHFLGRSTAAQRHAVWCATLVGCALLPATDFALSAGFVHFWPSGPAVALKIPYSTAVPAEQQDTLAPLHTLPSFTVLPKSVAANPMRWTPPLAPDDNATTMLVQSGFERLANITGSLLDGKFDSVFFALWVIIANLLLARLAIGYVRLTIAKRQLQMRDLNELEWEALFNATARPVAIGYSSILSEPCVIGFARPVIALPHTITQRLSAQDAMRVIRHECAHVSRWDDVTNLCRQTVAALLFFNPIVHVIARALDVDREIACDDVAATDALDRVEFAKCLFDIATAAGRRGWLPVTGLIRNNRQIAVRIAHLLDRNHRGSTRIGRGVKLSLIAVVASVVAFAAVQIAPSKPLMQWTPVVAPDLPRTELVMRPMLVAPFVSPTIHGQRSQLVHTVVVVHEHVAQTRHTSGHTIAIVLAARPVKPLLERSVHLVAMPAEPVEARMAALMRNPVLISETAMVAARTELMRASAQVDAVSGSLSGEREHDEFLQAMRDAGFTGLSVDDLIAIHNAGVSTTFLNELHAAGLTPMPPRDLIDLANAGVSAAFLVEVHKAGYDHLSCADMIRLSNAGIQPAYMAGLAGLGYHLPLTDVVRLRDAGITPAYIGSLAEVGYKRLSPDELIRLTNAGVIASFIARLEASGVERGTRPSVNDLIKLSNAGV